MFEIGDFVKVRDLAGQAHLATIEKIKHEWCAVKLCSSKMTTVRFIDDLKMASVGEAMLWKLENAR